MTQEHFRDPAAASRYVDGLHRSVPGVAVLHDLVDRVLSEAVGSNGRVLVVGAGGGIELRHLAERHAGWTFDGVDPSAEMLRLAEATLGPLVERVRLHDGYVDRAPGGPFDAATCLLVLHFVPEVERRTTLTEIRRRLRPGAPLVTFHHSVPDAEEPDSTWLARSVRFASGPDVDEATVLDRATTMRERLTILSPERDAAMLRDAGFSVAGEFYGALSLRGWLAFA